MLSRPDPTTLRRHVTDLVVGGHLSVDSIDAVVEAGLAGYAVERLSGPHRGPGSTDLLADARLGRARLKLAARHATVRRSVIELLDAWREVGIEALLFKGFYLAEFVYQDSSIRTYSDVDVGLRSNRGLSLPELATSAAAEARRHGWHVSWYLGEGGSVSSYHDAEYDGHELLQLVHEATGISLDAHRRFIHKNVNLSRRRDVGDAITGKVWAAAVRGDLEGVPVWLPDPLDAALVGLIAARSWSGDRYRLRPHDLLDLEVLMAHGKFDLRALSVRARELGLSATTRLFLKRCDPLSRTIDLRTPSPLEAFVFDAMLITERAPRGLEQLLAALFTVPSKVNAVARVLPNVARQVRLLREGSRPAWASMDQAGQQRKILDRRSWQLLQYGVRRSLQLHGIRPEQDPELAVACLYGSLVGSGFTVARRSSGERVWFEYEGEVLRFDKLGEIDTSEERRGSPGWPLRRAEPLKLAAWSRLVRLGPKGIRLRLEALYQLRRVVRALEKAPFKAVHEELTRHRVSPARTKQVMATASGADPAAIGRATESAARFVPAALCVARSLAAQVMLNRRGVPSTIHFGFKHSPDGKVEGHAWLEAGGAVVTGDVGLGNFTRVATFES